MTLEFTCQKCESSFEIESREFLDGTEKIVCPHCDAKAPTTLSDDFSAALQELQAQVAAMSKKFGVSFQVDSEEVAELEEDEDEDEEDDEEEADDEDELDFEESDDEDEELEEEEP